MSQTGVRSSTLVQCLSVIFPSMPCVHINLSVTQRKNGVFTGRGYAQTYEHPTTKGMKNPLTCFIAALLKCREVKNMPMFVQLRMADVHIYVYISVPLHSTSSSSPTTLNFSLQFRIWFVVN